MRYIALVDGKAGAYGVIAPDFTRLYLGWLHDG